jgi:hypothetical protein
VAEDSEGDGEPTAEPVQCLQVMFGCCGQAFSNEYVEGHCAPKSTYGFGVFDKIEDEEERALIKQMLANAFDCMQQCEDHIEQIKLKNLLPLSDPHQYEHFTKQVREELGALFTHQKDFIIQLKNIMQGKCTCKHKDSFNCTWNGYMKTLSLHFMWVDAVGEVWSLKLVTYSCFKAGNFL